MTELEAMNMLLRAVGYTPVNDYDSGLPVAIAVREVLARHRKLVQKRGWWFNIDFGIVYQADTQTGFVLIPSTVSSVTFNDKAFVMRNDRAYDRYNQTTAIGEDLLTHTVINILNWDEMPEVVQEHAAYTAGAEFVLDEISDQEKADKMEKGAVRTMIQIKKQDLENAQFNMFDNPHVRRARAGVKPYGSGRVRFSGDPDA